MYQWKIERTPVITDLMQNICNIVSPVDTDFMSPLDLQCTASVSNGPDKPYEESWFRVQKETIVMTNLSWNTDVCFVGNSFTDQDELYILDDSEPLKTHTRQMARLRKIYVTGHLLQTSTL